MLQVPKLLNGQSGIYLIQNKETGKFYIGSSNNLKNRFRQHNQMLVAGNHKNSRLQEDYNQYGGESFECKVLCLCSVDELLYHEQLWFDQYKQQHPTYHKGSKVSNPNLGTTRPDYHANNRTTLDDYRRKAQEALAEKRRTDKEYAKRCSEIGKASMARLRGDPDIEAKRKHNAAEAQRTPELREVRRQQMLDRLATGWRPPTGNNKITVRHVPSGKLFDSLTEAADFAGVSLTTLHRWVKGRPTKGKRVGFNFDWRLG